MKKGLVFTLGVVTGIILTVATIFLLARVYYDNESPEFYIAEHQIPFTIATKFKVFQVTDNGALANCEDNSYMDSSFTGPVVFIKADGNIQFYDDQLIEVPTNKKVVQVGTFRYETRLGEKVVPVIKII